MRDALFRLMAVLPGRGRLRAVAFQLSFFTLLLAVSLWFYLTAAVGRACEPVGKLATGGCAVMLVGILVREINWVCMVHRSFHAAYKRLYSRPVQYEPVDLAERGFDTDPMSRKFSQEVKELGGLH